MHIRVKNVGGDTFDFDDIDTEVLVSDFKQKIAEKTNYTLSTIRLIYMGKILGDNKKLSEYNLPAENVNMIMVGKKNEPEDSPSDSTMEQTRAETSNRLLNFLFRGNIGDVGRHIDYQVNITFNGAICNADDISREFIEFIRRLYNIHPEGTNPAERMTISHVEEDTNLSNSLSSLLNMLINPNSVPNDEAMHETETSNPSPELTEQDNMNINYLVELDLGISRDEIIRVYVENHYDTEMTANILMSRIGM